MTKEDFVRITEYNNEIDNLKYGITMGDERYKKGIELFENIKDIIQKLQSQENQDLFLTVIEEEKDFMKEEYNFHDEDIETIFDEYYLDYRDRGIISHVFDDITECAKEEAEQFGYFNKNQDLQSYFNYEKFGEDLLESEQYLQLKDGRIVILNL